jgi:glycosyltransferase involved in cell wall biosynthesis
MKLLIITQKVNKNDSNLGFFHDWLLEFSKHVEELSVICLEKGEYDLPKNVKVYSLGKETGTSQPRRLLNLLRYMYSLSGSYDAVFVHMNPIYIVLLGWYWRAQQKTIGLWYTHKSVDWKLRIAEVFTDHIFTASTESFRLPSKKVHITGHGINTEIFNGYTAPALPPFSLITTGRISPTKNIEEMITATKKLNEEGIKSILTIIGAPVTSADIQYEKKLKENSPDAVQFVGVVSHDEIPNYLQKAHVFINLSKTGSIDKSVLEAWSMNVSTITSNEAFATIPESGYIKDSSGLYLALEAVYKNISIGTSPKTSLREYVVKNHSLSSLIPHIIKFYE